MRLVFSSVCAAVHVFFFSIGIYVFLMFFRVLGACVDLFNILPWCIPRRLSVMSRFHVTFELFFFSFIVPADVEESDHVGM